jgi:uncharacterized membrane protein
MPPALTSSALPAPLLASNVAFAVIFGIFVVALVVLIVITLTWAIRRDRVGRAAWRQRQAERYAAGEGDVPPAPRP